DTGWGKKAARAFTQSWHEKGGDIAASATFDKNTEFSKLSGQLLHVDKSHERARQLGRLLKENLGFQARRRQDIDMVFIAASPAEARQIKPALSYQFAGSVPAYATSSVFSGTTNTARDNDLDGIRVPVMPWSIPGITTTIERNITTAMPQSKGSYGTLYALGADAYKLYPKLQQLSNLPGSQVEGLTGWLSINKDHRVDRELTWQVFRNGRLVPVPPKPLNKSPANALALNKNKR
ncbi:penicillin-binding protein activator, partial [Endozoicomonas sp.]|nr:penicillin-binding protein activator [Endozoicomonas sp.]